jgi:hypothetical protein
MPLSLIPVRLYNEWDVYYYQTDNRPIFDLIDNQNTILDYINTNESTWTGGLSYTLPTASNSVLGGIKVGSGLTINLSGILSAVPSTPFSTIATTTVLGLVKVGSGLSISPTGLLSASYTLTPATTTTLGGVRIGSGLVVDSQGLVSAAYPNAYVLPSATTITLGGVKIGNGLSAVGTDGTIKVDLADDTTPDDNTTTAVTPAYLQLILSGLQATPGAGLLLSKTVITTVGPWTYTLTNPSTENVRITISGGGGGGGGADYVPDQLGSTTGNGQPGGKAGLSIAEFSASLTGVKTFNGVIGGAGDGGLGANFGGPTDGGTGGTTYCYKLDLSSNPILVNVANGGVGGMYTFDGFGADGTASGGTTNTTGGGSLGGEGGSEGLANNGYPGAGGYVIIEELT